MAYSTEINYHIDLEAKGVRIKVSGRLASSEAFPLGSYMAIFFQCPHLVICLCVRVLIFSSYGDTSHIGPQHITLFHLNYIFKGFISKYSHILM